MNPNDFKVSVMNQKGKFVLHIELPMASVIYLLSAVGLSFGMLAGANVNESPRPPTTTPLAICQQQPKALEPFLPAMSDRQGH